jgi:hypothetical protein
MDQQQAPQPGSGSPEPPQAPPPPAASTPPAAWQPTPSAAPPQAPPPPPAGWTAPPSAPPPSAPPPPAVWAAAAPPPVRSGGVTGLAKLGALILFLMGILWSLIGLAFVVGGGFLTQILEGVEVEGLGEGVFGNILAGLAVGVGLVILVIAIMEAIVGILSWRGSGFARVMGILYGLLFGLGTLSSVMSASQVPEASADGAGGGIVAIVIAIAYLYVAIVFIFRYRSAS